MEYMYGLWNIGWLCALELGQGSGMAKRVVPRREQPDVRIDPSNI